MMPSTTEWLGYSAAVLTTVSFVPQVWHTFRTRDVSGISLGMYSIFTIGVALWLVYGVALGEWPIIAANALTLVLATAMLVMKLGGLAAARAAAAAAAAGAGTPR